MFGSDVLDVLVGLFFVYLLASLIVSAVNELIAGWLGWRAANLRDGIRNMINSPGAEDWAEKLYNHPLIQGMSPLPTKAFKIFGVRAMSDSYRVAPLQQPSNNSGYNPVGTIANPWPASIGDLTNQVIGGMPNPQSGKVYTVRHTPKTIVVTSGTGLQIAINGVDTGLTAGVFKLGLGETIAIGYDVAPATAVFAE